MTAQRWSAEGYATNARFVAELGAPVVELLAPVPGEAILDLGCGDGHLTERLVALGCEVVGVDASPELVAAARSRGLDVRLQDAQALDLPERFDAVFSNAALHWMKDAGAVIAGVHRHLRPGGRFVGEMGGHGNVAAIVTALVAVLARRGIDARPLHPWHFPTAGAWRALLEQQGFTVESVALIPRPTPLPTGMAGWLQTFAAPFLRALPAGERESATAEAVALLEPALRDPTGAWTADYVRLRFRAVRPG
jgi:trans-aconitate methyltransferase